MKYRIEHDSLGDVKVPEDRLWGAQTQRSHDNFKIGTGIETMPDEIIKAFGVIKKAAAMANRNVKCTICANVTLRSKMMMTASVDAIILIALPTIWTFAQSGTTKSRISSEMPFFLQQSSVTGITADEEAMERPVRYAGAMFQRHRNGFFPAIIPATV